MRFAALRAPWYKGYLAGGSLLMAGDNAEHAITYFMMWQLFHSPLLAGFAVISHWLPHLFFSIPFGGLADRYDGRRLIQISAGLFMIASVGWGRLLLTHSLQPWHCAVLLVIHGFASALWQPADGVMIYDIVGPRDLPSGVRLMSTGLSLGQLVGPVAGAALLFTVGPAIGMFVNVAFYLPFMIYLFALPLDGHQRRTTVAPRLSFRAVFGVVRELPRYPSVLIVVIMQAALGLLIGTALMPLLPEFGALLGQDQSGFGYGLLLIATSFGAVVGGITLEASGRVRASTRLAVGATGMFGLSVLVFAISRSFPLSLVALVLAGLSTILAASTSQTIVQLDAPPEKRGRFLGMMGMTGMGFRVGSGLIIGLLGSALGVTVAVGIDASALALVAITLLIVVTVWRRKTPTIEPDRSVPVETGSIETGSIETA